MAAGLIKAMGEGFNSTMSLYRLYKYILYDLADHRSNGCFLIETPWPMLVLVVFYLYFVKRIGPELMKNREALKIEGFIKLYNVLQIVWNVYLFSYVFPIAGASQHLENFSIWCLPLSYSEEDPLAVLFLGGFKLYYYNKLVDLFDTVFFILRKQEYRATYLHVYHHVVMSIFTWCAVRYAPGGCPISVGILNAFIHVVMYTYYFLSLTRFRKTLWWKRYLTQLQMIQFLLILIHNVPVFFFRSCYYNPIISMLTVLQPVYFFYLFVKYYFKTYFERKKK